jgi:hypothetical protein
VLRRTAIALATLLLLGLPPAYAHGPERRAARELVRLQGYVGAEPTGAEGEYEVTVTARGVDHRFRVTEWRRFVLGDPPPTAAAPERAPARLVLQADFEVLSRLAKARADQLLTLLAERRAGSSDLFVLTLDRCPP